MNILTKLRLIMLPWKKIVNALSEQGIVYEIGCGNGSLAHALSINLPGCQIIGIDYNKKKINLSKKINHQNNLAFQSANALNYFYKNCSAAIFSDFLHHITYENQEILLKKISQKMRPGGAIIIKEINKKGGIRMWLSRFWDLLLYPQDKIYYRTNVDWKRLVENLGFNVRVSQEVLWFPGSTNLFVCTKK